MLKNLNYFLQAVIIYFFFIIGKLLGKYLSKKVFSFLFSKLGPLFKSKDIIYKNLKIFNKNLNNYEREKIITNMWKNYGFTFIEYIFLKSFRKKNTHINIFGEEVLKKIILKNKPVIFISGHFSNFELMSMEITKKNIPLAAIYRPLNNFFLNPIMEYVRMKYICPNQIPKGKSGLREVINRFKNGYSIALMVDQRVGEGLSVNFFNQPARTTTIPAQLALRYNCKLVPISLERREGANFEMTIHEPYKIEKTGNDEEDTKNITLKINQIVEKMIINNPKQWIWSHNRWK